MNDKLLQYCLSQVEEKLGWTSSDTWQNQDFELLSDRIFDETQVRLSITTLKRVWGKVNYQSAPSISTLNALSQFISYENWSELRNERLKVSPREAHPQRKLPSKYLVSVLSLIVLFFVIFGISQSRSSGSTPVFDMSTVEFEAEPVTYGMPNSVVFKYSYGTNEVDLAQIQQSWNDALTFDIDPTRKEATGIYYYPGYFRAKLLADGQILREQALKVGTRGWMGTLDQETQPRYLYYGELQQEGQLGITQTLIDEIYSQELEQTRLLGYHYFDDLPLIKGDDFVYEARFRNTYNKSNGICKRTQVLVHGENTVYLVPFSIPGCTSDLNLISSGHTYQGKENDLSSFGADMNEWQTFRLETKNGKSSYYLNNELIMEKEIIYRLGDIVGFKFRFEGAGEVDYVRITGGNGNAYAEEFNGE